MSPVKNRSGGRRHKGGRDTRRKARFQPGTREADPTANVEWSQATNFRMTAHSDGDAFAMTAHSDGDGFAMAAHSSASSFGMNPNG